MGPHVFACGNQRGQHKGRSAQKLQWGRTFLRAEIAAWRGVRCELEGLQWGRTFLRAEIRIGNRWPHLVRNASMGPHVFACGNPANPMHPVVALELQWGRTFLRAEIVPIGEYRNGSVCASMGPHVFACGNFFDMMYSLRSLRCFNGAARFCVRKSSARTIFASQAPNASMGPHVFACGNSIRSTLAEPPKSASMGPHVFACGNRAAASIEDARPLASMGPHVFACGNQPAKRARLLREDTLQWGRTFLRAEITRRHANTPARQQL